MSNKNRRYMLKMIYLDTPLLLKKKRTIKVNPGYSAFSHSKSPVSAHSPMPVFPFLNGRFENKENSPDRTDSFHNPSNIASLIQNSRNLNNRVQTAHYSFLNKSGLESSSILHTKEVRLRQENTQKMAMKHYISTRSAHIKSRQNGLKKAESTRKNARKEQESPYSSKMTIDKSQQLFNSVLI